MTHHAFVQAWMVKSEFLQIHVLHKAAIHRHFLSLVPRAAASWDRPVRPCAPSPPVSFADPHTTRKCLSVLAHFWTAGNSHFGNPCPVSLAILDKAPHQVRTLFPCAVSLVGLDSGGMDGFRLGRGLDALFLVSRMATTYLPAALVGLYHRYQCPTLFPYRSVHDHQSTQVPLQTLSPQRRLLVDV